MDGMMFYCSWSGKLQFVIFRMMLFNTVRRKWKIWLENNRIVYKWSMITWLRRNMGILCKRSMVIWNENDMNIPIGMTYVGFDRVSHGISLFWWDFLGYTWLSWNGEIRMDTRKSTSTHSNSTIRFRWSHTNISSCSCLRHRQRWLYQTSYRFHSSRRFHWITRSDHWHSSIVELPSLVCHFSPLVWCDWSIKMIKV